jgi:hypothetical protein
MAMKKKGSDAVRSIKMSVGSYAPYYKVLTFAAKHSAPRHDHEWRANDLLKLQ